MAVKLSTTSAEGGNKVNILVYGDAGIGKTVLCSTMENPFIISAEGGLLSLKGHDIPCAIIKNRQDCNEVYEWIQMSSDAKQFKNIAIDSLSEIAEVLLGDEKQLSKDPRQAYGVMDDEMSILIRGFRDLPNRNVYFSAKVKKLVEEGSGAVSYIPSVPGQSLLQKLPYFFDEVFAMKIGRLEGGETYRYLQTASDLQWIAKDRSGKLDRIVQPNLAEIMGIINGDVPNKPQESVPEDVPETEKSAEAEEK